MLFVVAQTSCSNELPHLCYIYEKLISIFVLMSSTYQRRPLDQQQNKDIKNKAYTIAYISLLGVLLILWFAGSGSPFGGNLSEKRISEPNQTIMVRIALGLDLLY